MDVAAATDDCGGHDCAEAMAMAVALPTDDHGNASGGHDCAEPMAMADGCGATVVLGWDTTESGVTVRGATSGLAAPWGISARTSVLVQQFISTDKLPPIVFTLGRKCCFYFYPPS